MTLTKLGFDEKDKRQSKRKVLNLAAGGVAGAVSTLAVAPIDTIKDVQRQNKAINRNEMKDWEVLSKSDPAIPKPRLKPTGFKEVTKDIWSHEKGVGNKLKAFYQGSGAGVLKVAPAMAISFLAYDMSKEQINKYYPSEKKAEYLIEKLSTLATKVPQKDYWQIVAREEMLRKANTGKFHHSVVGLNKDLTNVEANVRPRMNPKGGKVPKT